MDKPAGRRFRSREWFADPHRSDMTALYLERFMNYGLTPEELRSGRPIVGIAQTGSDLSPCNRIHLDLARRLRDGIRDAGGCILVMRGAGPIGWPGSAEVVNMQPPDALIRRGIPSLPTLGDGRQSGSADSSSILNVSPESAVGGGLRWLQSGDVLRIDLNHARCDALVSDDEIAPRLCELPAPPVPPSQSPWEELYRAHTGQLVESATPDLALKHRRIAEHTPRHNH
jgi:dihydroxyacid dehydratase/phosphogluconate dehydratase